LDSKGLVAAWREGLLAQKVLEGKTTGYRNHPQLERFKASIDPLAMIATYLEELAVEAERRHYRFDRARIHHEGNREVGVGVAEGQIWYEFALLKRKLKERDVIKLAEISDERNIKVNAAFHPVPGGTAVWEKIIAEVEVAMGKA
jgi:hypothetical protein